MKLFDVYPLYDLEPVRAAGSFVWDKNGVRYLDLYGGHAVISIGHTHPHYVKSLTEQLSKIGFYSNSVKIPLQEELAEKLGKLSGYEDYTLFLANSGAEANENALKLASFHNGRKKIITFSKAFHGRTSAAVAVTDSASIQAPINKMEDALFLPFNDLEALKQAFAQHQDICAVIVEGIQGVGGIQIPTDEFLLGIQQLCQDNGAVFILDEIQSGYGRTGKFFAHQHTAGLQPDIISVAKGMGNGFPIGGVLIHPKFKASHGLLGTTFGGNHLACAAGIAVLDVLKDENLLKNAAVVGTYLMDALAKLPGIKALRGRGLMIGIEFDYPVDKLRKELLFDHKIFTGVSGKNIIRLLPSLALTQADAAHFIEKFEELLVKQAV